MGVRCSCMQNEQRLLLELENAKAENEMLRERIKSIDQHMTRTFATLGLFTDRLDQPHYLTQKDIELYRKKGFEALLLSWHEEIIKNDCEGKVKYNFPLEV